MVVHLLMVVVRLVEKIQPKLIDLRLIYHVIWLKMLWQQIWPKNVLFSYHGLLEFQNLYLYMLTQIILEKFQTKRLKALFHGKKLILYLKSPNLKSLIENIWKK